MIYEHVYIVTRHVVHDLPPRICIYTQYVDALLLPFAIYRFVIIYITRGKVDSFNYYDE